MTNSRCHKKDIWLEFFSFFFFFLNTFFFFQGHRHFFFGSTFLVSFFYYFSLFGLILILSGHAHAKYIEAKRGPVFSLTETKIDATLQQTGTFSFSLFIIILNSLLYPPPPFSPHLVTRHACSIGEALSLPIGLFFFDPNICLPFSVNYQSTYTFFFFSFFFLSWVEGGKQQQQ